MTKVHMIIGGKLALVPEEHAKTLAKKEMLVARAAELNRYRNNLSEVGTALQAAAAEKELHSLVAQIQRINRRIPACVQFPTEYKAFA